MLQLTFDTEEEGTANEYGHKSDCKAEMMNEVDAGSAWSDTLGYECVYGSLVDLRIELGTADILLERLQRCRHDGKEGWGGAKLRKLQHAATGCL